MTARKSKTPRLLSKAPTGIQGFDDLSRGGLPRNRTSRVMGGPGTLRWKKEAQERARKLNQQAEYGHKRRQLQFAEADIAARIAALQLDLERQRAELARCTLDDETLQVSASEWQNKVRTMRSADTVVTAEPAPVKRRAARISTKSRTNGDQGPQNGP